MSKPKDRRKVIEVAQFKFIRGPEQSVRLPSGGLADLERIRCGDCWPLVLFTGNRRRADFDFEPPDEEKFAQTYCEVGNGACNRTGCGFALAERIADDNDWLADFDLAKVALAKHRDDLTAHQGGFKHDPLVDEFDLAFYCPSFSCPVCADARGLIIALLRQDPEDVGRRGERLPFWVKEHNIRAGTTAAESAEGARIRNRELGDRVAAEGAATRGVVAAAQDAAFLSDEEVLSEGRAHDAERAYRETNAPPRRETCKRPSCRKPLMGRQRDWCSRACRQWGSRNSNKV